MLDVYAAVRSRTSVRAFLPRPVPDGVLQRVLDTARRTPSGGNLQPWQVFVVSGSTLEEIKARTRARLAAVDPPDEPEVAPYPPVLEEPHAARLADMGARRYGALGIARDDRTARLRAHLGNWECWGAPTALFCYLRADMGPPQWLDVGMFLQSVMLLLRDEGLDSCPQIAWLRYHDTVDAVLTPPAGLTLACGLSIGYADPAVPRPRMPRAPLSELVSFRN